MKINNIGVNNFELVRRLGKPIESNKSRPIIVELNSKKLKREILQKAKLLKGTRIFIEEDYTPQVLQNRKILKPHLLKARKDGYKASLNQDTLYVNGNRYKAMDFGDDIEIEDRPYHTSGNKEAETENAILFALSRRMSTSLYNVNNAQNYEEILGEAHTKSVLQTDEREIKSKGTPKSYEKKMKDIKSKSGPMDKHIQTRLRTQSASKNLEPKKQGQHQ